MIFFLQLTLVLPSSLPPVVAPWSCAGCRADFGSIAVATETGADVTLVAGRLAGALIVTVTGMQLDGTSSVALQRGVCVCGWMRMGHWHWVNSPHPLIHTHTHTE